MGAVGPASPARSLPGGIPMPQGHSAAYGRSLDVQPGPEASLRRDLALASEKRAQVGLEEGYTPRAGAKLPSRLTPNWE